MVSLADASRQNHGPTFHHEFIGALAAKILPGGADQVVSELRRKIWLPLFWPETLSAACGVGSLTYRPARPIHTMRRGGMGALASSLLARVRDPDGIQVAQHRQSVVSGKRGLVPVN